MKAFPLCGVSIAAILAITPAPLSQGADSSSQVQASKTEGLLTPFQPASKPLDMKIAQQLAGRWQGTFTHKDQDGTTYLVEVMPGLTAMKVSIVQPKLPPATVQPPQIHSQGLGFYLQPTTPEAPQPAIWDGGALQTSVHERHQDGDATVAVDKQLSLAVGRDSKHALFTYDIQVKTVSGPKTNITKLHGSGILTRPR